MKALTSRRGVGTNVLVIVAIGVSIAALLATGYSAVAEWRHAAALVASRRAESAADLLVSALSRDMRSVQHDVLTSIEPQLASPTAHDDLLHPMASAFARYPYPEAFFYWEADSPPEGVVFYTRADRRPSWLPAEEQSPTFPVVVDREPPIAKRLIDRVANDTWEARRFSIFDIDLAGSRYEVVALLSYADPIGEHPKDVIGFLVNMDWARRNYFDELATQIAQIDGGVQFVVLDDRGLPVVQPGARALNRDDAPSGHRDFPVAFFDPMDVAIDPPSDLHIASWTAVATAQHDPTLDAAEKGARRTLAVASVMALTLTIGVVFAFGATRASAQLAEMRSNFVSAVTHELKTPIANLRAISETMASKRGTLEMTQQYAQMGIRESSRLSRLVDNLLAYARVTDVADVYTFESVCLEAIVTRSLQEFALNLKDASFDVDVDLSEDVAPVRADPRALGLVLNNLIDNAIRYSRERRHLSIAARETNGSVTLSISDEGIGIPATELQNVKRRFWHGRDGGGNGLGLAIVDRVVRDHGGTLSIESTLHVGTTVTVTLPKAT